MHRRPGGCQGHPRHSPPLAWDVIATAQWPQERLRINLEIGLFGRYRYIEHSIPPLHPIYALGQFRSQGVHHAFDEQADVRELLAEWKRDEAALLHEFDADGNGEIDLTEWEQVRARAVEQVRAKLAEQAAQPDIHVLARSANRKPFLISAVPQEKLVRRYRLQAALGFAGFLLSGSAATVALVARGLL